MNGLMMDYPLTLSTIFRRAEAIYPRHEIVWRIADKSVHRYTYGDFAGRARRLASALLDLGVKPGDRVATLGWNHGPHLEAYFGIPLMGGVLHTLNLRLHPDELAYIVNHAEDRVMLVDESLLPLWEQVRPQRQASRRRSSSARPSRWPTGILEYEALLAKSDAGARPARPRRARRRRDVLHDRHHRQAEGRALLAPRASCCTRSASRSTTAWASASTTSCCRWCRCSTPTRGACRSRRVMVGAKLVMPGPHLDPASLVDLFQTRARHDHRRRADDLDGRAAVPRRQPRHVRPLRASARCTSAAPPSRRR